MQHIVVGRRHCRKSEAFRDHNRVDRLRSRPPFHSETGDLSGNANAQLPESRLPAR